MENASKALTIAGTILISLIVISALIFMFREIRGIKTQNALNQKTQSIIEFNKSYESYNKNLYGSELLSLANKMSDYNKSLVKKYGENKDGYEDMQLNVKFENETTNKDFTYFIGVIKQNDELMKTYKSSSNLETLYKAMVIDKDKPSAKEQKEQILRKIGKQEDEIINKIASNYEQYSKYKELKTKKFKCENIEYSKNGRIRLMQFTEQ